MNIILDFILSFNEKSLMDILYYLNEKTNLLIWSLFFQVNNVKSKLNAFYFFEKILSQILSRMSLNK